MARICGIWANETGHAPRTGGWLLPRQTAQGSGDWPDLSAVVACATGVITNGSMAGRCARGASQPARSVVAADHRAKTRSRSHLHLGVRVDGQRDDPHRRRRQHNAAAGQRHDGKLEPLTSLTDPALIRVYEHAQPGAGRQAFIGSDGMTGTCAPSRIAVWLAAARDG